jgi:hypothetical protein
MMQALIKRVVFGLLGVVVMIAYWTFTGSGDSSEIKGIPAKVGLGGGGTLAIQIESTTPARFSIGFDDDDKHQEYWAPVAAGTQTWAIDVPKNSGGYIELNAENPKVGDKLSWKITLNGETVDEQNETLEKALTSGYAFFLQSFYDDYSSISAPSARDDEED